jgi:hydroxymethylpyrimidine pyrophosphatase-like HAD family hydrolase
MTFRALATDYDGTIASDGRVDEATVAALMDARARGARLILVTGRELTDLCNTFAYVDLFDRVVAENGALVYDPSTRHFDVLAPAPPQPLVERLTAERIPLSVGHSIIASIQPHEQTMLAAIRDLGLEWHVIFNKGAVMALPADVTKATGLAVAVANALPTVKAMADLVTEGARGAGVVELVDLWRRGRLDSVRHNPLRHSHA